MLMMGLLICCSSPCFVSLTPLIFGKNLARPDPYSKSKFGGSRAEIDTRLPWYPSGFV